MVEIIIYGAGKIGLKLKDKLLNNSSINVLGFLDSYKKNDCKVCVLDIDEVEKETPIVISVLNTSSIIDIYNKLKEKQFKNIYWYYDMNKAEYDSENFLEEECFHFPDWNSNILPHIEFHISDKCNLNCKGCTHFSPLFDTLGASLEERIEDIKKVKKIFDHVFRLDILGGEPLLNTELKQYVLELKKLLPDTFIQIFTNGILIPTLSDDVLNCIRDNDIAISISEYYPTHQMIDKITTKLDKYNIRYKVVEFDKKQKFNKPISTSSDTKYPFKCISDGCVTVADGKIAKCPTLMYITKFNETYNENLPTDGIFYLDECYDGQQLLKELDKRVPLCKHCIEYEIDWEVCGKDKRFEDFAVTD